MKVEDFTDTELQFLRNSFKKLEVLSKYFEGDYKENLYYLENVTRPPISFVKEIDLPALLTFILRQTYKGAAEKLGVSVPFLKGYIDKQEIKELATKDSKHYLVFNKYSSEELINKAEKIKYISILSTLSGWSEASIRKLLGKRGINVDSDLTTSRGRRAELFYSELRGSNILLDMNEKDPQHPFDFKDKEYGKVNVRSGKPYSIKSGGKRWHFKTRDDISDYFAFVGYDDLGEIVEFVKVVKNENLPDKGLLVDSDDLSSIGVNIYLRGENFKERGF